MCIYVYIHTYIYICIYVKYVHINIYMCIYMYSYTAHIFTYNTNMHLYTTNLHTYIYYTHTHIYVQHTYTDKIAKLEWGGVANYRQVNPWRKWRVKGGREKSCPKTRTNLRANGMYCVWICTFWSFSLWHACFGAHQSGICIDTYVCIRMYTFVCIYVCIPERVCMCKNVFTYVHVFV